MKQKVFRGIPVLIPVLLCLFSAVLYLLAGCSASGSAGQTDSEAGNGRTVLRMWHIWASDAEANKAPLEKAVADFNAENDRGIEVVLEATENETYKQMLTTMVAANEAADIYFSWSGSFLRQFAAGEKVLALNDRLSDETKDRLLPGSCDSMTFDGKLYGLGFSQTAGTFFVNTDLFDRYGVKIPENWEELTEAVKSFRDQGISTPMALGGREAWCIDLYFTAIAVREAGAEACLNALSGEGSYTDPGIKESARKLQMLVNMGAFGDEPMRVYRDEAERLFYEGKSPMYFNGSWTIGSINREDCPVQGKVRIVSFPVFSEKGSLTDCIGSASECFVVNADTAYPEESVYALSEILPRFARNLSDIGAGLSIWDADAEEAADDSLTAILKENLAEASSWTPMWSSYLPVDDASTYMKLLQQLFAGDISPDSFVLHMQQLNRTWS